MDNIKENDFNDKEHNKEMIQSTNQELQDFFKGSKTVLGNHRKSRKYSEIFHEFMQPIIEEVIQDKKSLTKILDWGQLVWNKAVAEDFPCNSKSKDIETLFPLFKATFQDKSLISEFITRKKEMFSKENFFIVKQTSLLDTEGRLAISVAVLEVEE